ncbi:MAG: murein transglycosylase [Rhodobacteraceae bacterium PARR1]|nr:MAG: murein transglycosylase [Rhodobacteraceae bacterium PARR1]
MDVTRRFVLMGLSAGGLSACVGGGGGSGSAAVADPGLRPQPNAGWSAWVADFMPRAQGAGISPAVLDRAFRNAGFLPGVIDRDRNQTEFTRTLEDYLAIAASDQRIALGRAAMARHGGELAAIQARYGVESEVVAAVWGLESQYGTRRGDIPVMSALSTLAYEGRRGAFFEGQLIAALKIVQAGDVAPDAMVGSWAGAMGHTQFIPTSYLQFAVDFTGDGRRDIWAEDPTDALASTAAYLARSGWQTGQLWGAEVQLPPGFDTGLTGREARRASSDWAAMGVRAADGGPLPDHGPGAVVLPQGPMGPAFILWRNFGVILRYNNALNYGIGVGHLSDRLRGGGPIRAAFPPDAQGLTLADRQELQRRLTAAGFDTDGSDGVVGGKTVAAIKAYEGANGLPVTGAATAALLARLR